LRLPPKRQVKQGWPRQVQRGALPTKRAIVPPTAKWMVRLRQRRTQGVCRVSECVSVDPGDWYLDARIAKFVRFGDHRTWIDGADPLARRIESRAYGKNEL